MESEFKETDCYTYEKITYPGDTVRYYRLEPSENMHNPERFDSLAKRRISKKEWESIIVEEI